MVFKEKTLFFDGHGHDAPDHPSDHTLLALPTRSLSMIALTPTQKKRAPLVQQLASISVLLQSLVQRSKSIGVIIQSLVQRFTFLGICFQLCSNNYIYSSICANCVPGNYLDWGVLSNSCSAIYQIAVIEAY